jgi:WhiB family redox-sensing transcriptional regulator
MLTVEQVKQIKYDLLTMRQRDVCIKYDLSSGLVCNIANGTRWGKVVVGKEHGPYGETSPKIIFNLEDWTIHAACPSFDPVIFFPERGQSTTPAKQICVDCPVSKECLDYALKNHQYYGIWGGLTEGERKQIKKAKRVGVCPSCKLIRLFFEKGAKKCDKCSGTTRQRRLGLVSSQES